mmetsp:Transcript_11385/g.36436  ORF Transcript_11385/g.36436 Transcript_11385/m.36436 type:complete len:203 (-) Transcript_11385:184-792(-)
MGLDMPKRHSKHLGGYNVNLVHNDQSPFCVLHLCHNPLAIFRAPFAVRHHVVGGHEDGGAGGVQIIFASAREPADVLRRQGREGPHRADPLLDAYRVDAKDDAALLDGACSCDPRQSLASPARKHNDSRASSPIPKHLCKTLLLVGTNLGSCSQVDRKVWVAVVASKVVLFHQRKVCLHCCFLHLLDELGPNFEVENLLRGP